jgi:lysophospholipase L1-like esterase
MRRERLRPPLRPPGKYVALGDSYSAGAGSGGTSSGGSCLRNTNAYPALWSASHPAWQFTFEACAKATTATVQSTQLTAITAGTTLITLTAGANDGLILPAVTAACSVPSRAGDLFCTAATKYARSEINGPIRTNLSSLFAAIKAQTATVGVSAARIIVFGYPDFYRGVSRCGSDVTEQNDMDNTVNLLDTVIAHAVSASTGITFVDVRPAFDAHELCSQTPWLNGVIRNNPVGSFHPNQDGRHKGYEAALAAITG